MLGRTCGLYEFLSGRLQFTCDIYYCMRRGFQSPADNSVNSCLLKDQNEVGKELLLLPFLSSFTSLIVNSWDIGSEK
jgi:hypothetical protein